MYPSELQMSARRRLAMTQWTDTEYGRLWASVAFQGAGRSSRQSTCAPGVRPLRILSRFRRTKRMRAPWGSVSSTTSASHLQGRQQAYRPHCRPLVDPLGRCRRDPPLVSGLVGAVGTGGSRRGASALRERGRNGVCAL